MKKLEEEFGLPPLESFNESNKESQSTPAIIDEYEEAMSIAERIDNALREVKGMEVHDSEMDEIAREAVDSYKQLMSLGMNLTDMAAGPVFSNAAAMLKIALDAKDSKVSKKLKQLDLMLKKASLDARTAKKTPLEEDEPIESRALDRNELMKILNGKSSDS